jgi:hypothetical protein
MVAQGMSNRDVATQLFLSPRTVDFHLRNVFTKAGISSRGATARPSGPSRYRSSRSGGGSPLFVSTTPVRTSRPQVAPVQGR